ncbi:DEAD/DEAH box helicase [Acuticoccus sp. I52.16.1]|uniref:DEAD/DEAH box helicase n=1 Tax=Acuticoccus sp. I52.16.1 TaxID=2928472 RepID=UPI001FD46CED|nr:DEAD/DEAH box helicase [Acuticoccus sp. I52.16.1]UOM36013.1 DEAD/DEAH box helicase [Acuticoccus sp. I52.16.1]
MTTFSDLGLAEPILRATTAQGYTNPTPIQAKVIPAMLAGDDVLGTAQTGTGKTAAFTLPIIHRLNGRGRPEPRTCRALILAPTRELAAQIEENVRAYAANTKLSSLVVVGGVKPGPQERKLARGVDILIATPGRLEDHMRNRVVTLDAVQVAVLDEADQMLDLGFIPAIRRLFKAMPRERQTALLSATMPSEIRKLAADFLNAPKEIAVAPVSRPIEAIDQSVRHMDTGAKREALNTLMAATEVERAIVFTRTKRGADKVSRNLEIAGCNAVAIHGNKSQNQRQRALDAFRDGSVKVLVATDIAARGIDVSGISHVVNYELPNVPEAYVHRIGRTARAGRSGIAVSLCAPDELKLLRDIERLIGRRLAAENAPSSTAETAAAPAAKRSRPRRRKPDTPSNTQHRRSAPADRSRSGGRRAAVSTSRSGSSAAPQQTI